MRKTALSLIIASSYLFPSLASAQEGAVCKAENDALSATSEKYKPQFDQISQDGEKIGDDAKKKSDLSLEFDVKFKEHHWIFDLPSTTMKDRDIILNLPQVTMKTNEFSFDVPEIRMVRKKTGQIPEFYCDKGFIPKCTVRWTDTFADIPEPVMVTKRFSMDVPEVRMDETRFVMGIPEFAMVRQDWFVKIPEFTLKKIEIAGVPIYNDYKQQGEKLEARAGDVKSSMKSELVANTSNLFTCLRADLAQKREQAVAQVQGAVSSMQQSIENLKANGIDPAAVNVVIDGVSKSLAVAVTEMEAKVAEVVKQFDEAAVALDQNEKEAVARITTG